MVIYFEFHLKSVYSSINHLNTQYYEQIQLFRSHIPSRNDE